MGLWIDSETPDSFQGKRHLCCVVYTIKLSSHRPHESSRLELLYTPALD